MKNDLAFLLDTGLHLYEHQSTRNPNMPLRNLFYISREYQSMIQNQTLYSPKPVKLPAPHFIVFYNGAEPAPEKQVLQLSDCFEPRTEEPELELKVTVLNINPGYNESILAACSILQEYMLYVTRVRQHAESMSLKKAVERAVGECMEEGILSEFLRKHRAEAIEVCIFEFHAEEEWKKIRAAEYEMGLEEGISQGISQGIRQGISQGERRKLVSMVSRKWSKGLSSAQIAELLEEDLDTIEEIVAEFSGKQEL